MLVGSGWCLEMKYPGKHCVWRILFKNHQAIVTALPRCYHGAHVVLVSVFLLLLTELEAI